MSLLVIEAGVIMERSEDDAVMSAACFCAAIVVERFVINCCVEELA